MIVISSIYGTYRALWWNIPGLIFIVTFCCLDGLVIFAVYADCDLKQSKKVTSNDQVHIVLTFMQE